MNAVLDFKVDRAKGVDHYAPPLQGSDLIPTAGTPASNASVANAPWSLMEHTSAIDAANRKRKMIICAAIVVLHIVMVYVVVHWAPKIQSMIEPTMQVALLIDTQQQSHEVKEVLRPNLAPTEVTVITPALPIVESETAITAPVTSTVATSIAGMGNGAATPRLVSSVEYLRAPSPRYPAAARALRQSGVVMLRALIDINGRAREVTVQTSTGSRLLDDAGRTAVLDAQFKPYMENGRALEVYILVPIEFGTAR